MELITKLALFVHLNLMLMQIINFSKHSCVDLLYIICSIIAIATTTDLISAVEADKSPVNIRGLIGHSGLSTWKYQVSYDH